MLNAFFVALAVFVGVGGHELFGMVMLSRPIVVAPLTGLLLGDVQTGLLVGASLESIFMGLLANEFSFFRMSTKTVSFVLLMIFSFVSNLSKTQFERKKMFNRIKIT